MSEVLVTLKRIHWLAEQINELVYDKDLRHERVNSFYPFTLIEKGFIIDVRQGPEYKNVNPHTLRVLYIKTI